MSRGFKNESGAFNFDGNPEEFLNYADFCLDDAVYRAPEAQLIKGNPIIEAGNSYIMAAFLREESGKAALESCDYCRLIRPDKQLAILMFAKSIARSYPKALDIFLNKDSWIYKDVSLQSFMEGASKIDLEDFKEIAQAFYSRNEHYKKYPDIYGKEDRASNQELMYKMLFCAFSNMTEPTEDKMSKLASFLEENEGLGVTIGGFKKRLAGGLFVEGRVADAESETLFSPIVKGRDDPFLSPTPFSPMRRMSSASGLAASGGDSPYRDSTPPSMMPSLRLPFAAVTSSTFHGAAFRSAGPVIGVDDDSDDDFVIVGAAARLDGKSAKNPNFTYK